MPRYGKFDRQGKLVEVYDDDDGQKPALQPNEKDRFEIGEIDDDAQVGATRDQATKGQGQQQGEAMPSGQQGKANPASSAKSRA